MPIGGMQLDSYRTANPALDGATLWGLRSYQDLLQTDEKPGERFAGLSVYVAFSLDLQKHSIRNFLQLPAVLKLCRIAYRQIIRIVNKDRYSLFEVIEIYAQLNHSLTQ